ncbi:MULTISPECIES: tyrosine-type recombinase/integrase [Mesorhizobium]|uniref:DUF4102 domain-containing protein n=1 Tax=Mesorhizobium denitrificans TaxID=2294114 RepID=A0A371XGK6_9HYPH|nr:MULTISPECIES: integrase arm-type DNA-binding domain-containing protein [Mesorhizobium]RFC68357.1 DUF4102 domain-containing protein [Mesorhizobium denitrificans]
MALTLNRLTDTAVKAATKQTRLSDGGGLYLDVAPGGSKSWVFMWTQNRKRQEMGLGGYPSITLAKARQKAGDCRTAVAEGRNPRIERDREAEPTFADCAEKYIASVESEWRNSKHRYQWEQTLGETYCSHIRSMRVSEIEVEDVLKVLSPIWVTKNETASRVRGRIERVLEYAKVKGWRSGENPAAWRGNLRNLLPKRQKLQRGHQPALPYDEVPAFVVRLRELEAMAARALEFTILTAMRSGEVIGAKWSEFDLEKAVWTIPAARMKAGQQHKVPLSDRALEIMAMLKENERGEYAFAGEPRPGNRQDMLHGRPLSSMAMLMLLRRMKAENITVHGFRSSFRDWCGDQTNFPRDVAEAALAHKVGDETERAYRRLDALEKRRALMQVWADYVGAVPSDNVVRLADRTA